VANPLLLIIASLLAVAIALAYFLTRSHRTVSDGWTAITNGKDYGAKVEASGSFDFPIAPSSVHYVTKQCASLANAKGLRLRFGIAANPGVEFKRMQLVNGVETPVEGSQAVSPVPYFQRAHDDWSGAGKYEAFRWWATFTETVALAPGEYEFTAMFDQRWTAVMASNSIDQAGAFHDALANAGRVGFTFPGLTGYGHGATATGRARFDLIGFEIL
jgi:hypothetical protein